MVIIGATWLQAIDAQGNRRLDNEQDFVRQEIEQAIALNKTIIPVLVDDATMPNINDLPTTIQAVRHHHAITIHHDPYFKRDMNSLIERLENPLGKNVN